MVINYDFELSAGFNSCQSLARSKEVEKLSEISRKRKSGRVLPGIWFFTVLICMLSLSGCSPKEQGGTTAGESMLQPAIETTVETSSTAPAEMSDAASAETSSGVSAEVSIDLGSYFDGIDGCAVFFTPQDRRYSFYNRDLCEQEASPCSTFKIISTLLGLQYGVLKDGTSVMNYNGREYPVSDWNGNLTLQAAFRSSCIWYFRQVIDSVGEEKVKNMLDELGYGNGDVSEWKGSQANPMEELNGFWLDSSLKISPYEQVLVLEKIFEGNRLFRPQDVSTLKEMMLVEGSGARQIYGKTGSGVGGKAWFVGFVEEDGRREYFAFYLDDRERSKDITGNLAKEIALDVIADR